MKVLVFGARFDRSEKALLTGLVEKGVELEIIYDPDVPSYQLFDGKGVAAEQMRLASRIDFRAIGILRKMFRERGYDIIHSLTNRALSNSLLASRGMGLKHVAYRGTIGHLSRLDPASWLTYLNPGVDRIVCVSDAVRRYLLGLGLTGERLVTIHKGHDVEWYNNKDERSLSELGIPAGAFVVVYAGGYRPVKGVEYLVRSASFLKKENDIHFLLFGEGPLENKLKGLARDLGVDERVHFAGFRGDAGDLAGACDVFVMPSVAREGLPRAVIEAMSRETPSIVTNVGGLPEIVVDGESGIVVEPKSAEAIADAVRRLYGDRTLAGRLGVSARQRVKDRFDIATTIEKTYRLYEELLGTRSDL